MQYWRKYFIFTTERPKSSGTLDQVRFWSHITLTLDLFALFMMQWNYSCFRMIETPDTLSSNS